MKQLFLISLLGIFMAAPLAGCCGGGGEKAETTVIAPSATTTTVGEELMKLKEAYDAGAITEEEYKKAKEKILKGQ